jgi:hypothetical protein
MFTVVTESMVLYLEPHEKLKNVSLLRGWFSIGALEQVKRNLDNPDSVKFIWRETGKKSHKRREFKMIM